MMRNVTFVFGFVLAVLLSACDKAPTSPGGDDPKVPQGGTITIWYERPADLVCQSAGTEWAGFCTFRISFAAPSWPEGYRVTGETMTLQPDGRYMVKVQAPSSTWAGTLEAYVGEPFLCPPQQICGGAYTGRGITINGVRLPDAPDKFRFSYTPPDIILPR